MKVPFFTILKLNKVADQAGLHSLNFLLQVFHVMGAKKYGYRWRIFEYIYRGQKAYIKYSIIYLYIAEIYKIDLDLVTMWIQNEYTIFELWREC